MKEKCLNILSTVVSAIKGNKKVAIGVVAALLVVILIIVIAANGGKPSKYQEKIKTVTKALSSESKMKKALGDVIDVRAAAAWQEADKKASDFNKEYKNMKKNSDEVEDLEKALKKYAENHENYDIKVKNIKEPKKNSKNKKIYTTSANLVVNDNETAVKFIFYKGKIIDIMGKDNGVSYFENALKEYKASKKNNSDDDA